jgi:hypothetical protein
MLWQVYPCASGPRLLVTRAGTEWQRAVPTVPTFNAIVTMTTPTNRSQAASLASSTAAAVAVEQPLGRRWGFNVFATMRDGPVRVLFGVGNQCVVLVGQRHLLESRARRANDQC